MPAATSVRSSPESAFRHLKKCLTGIKGRSEVLIELKEPARYPGIEESISGIERAENG